MTHVRFRSTRKAFIKYETEFFSELFQDAINSNLGGIVLRTDTPSSKVIYRSPKAAAEAAFQFACQGVEIFYAVNPVPWSGRFKWELTHFFTFHARIQYGMVNKRKKLFYRTQDEVLAAVRNFPLSPSIEVIEDREVQCLWMLKEPLFHLFNL